MWVFAEPHAAGCLFGPVTYTDKKCLGDDVSGINHHRALATSNYPLHK